MTIAEKWRRERDARICETYSRLRVEMPNEKLWHIVSAISAQVGVCTVTVKNTLIKYDLYPKKNNKNN